MRRIAARLAPGHFVFPLIVILSGCAKHYRVEGLVLATDVRTSTLTVSHRPIPGFMPAMSMPFSVADPREILGLERGSRVEFDLVVRKGGSVAKRIRAIQPARLDSALPVPRKPAAGDLVPDFELTDQTGRRVKFSDLRGRVTVIDFIYSRCPLPEVCPRLSANFAYLARRQPEVALVSITLDPEWDTPEVLADYARRWQTDPARWKFLTGDPNAVRRVAEWFGMAYWPEDGAIAHSVTTAVIGAEGRLFALIEGSGYRPGQLVDLVRAAAAGR